MSKKGKDVITAAGAVVLRGDGDQREVLVVHRPRYKDWSLPKGKPKCDEDLPATAVREVLEETGVRIHLGVPVCRTHHSVGKQRKQVHWWLGFIDAERRRRPDAEVEKAVWMPLAKAAKRLTYDNERQVLAQSLDLGSAGAVLLVRHGKAMERKNWSGTDALRPLSGRGRRQARRLPALLAAYGVRELVSSTSTRCMQTLQPFAASAELPIEVVDLLSEEGAEGHLDEVAAHLAGMRGDAAGRGCVMAVCGHRPVIPAMRAGLGAADKPMLTAETLVVHLDADGSPVALETHKSAF